MVYLFIVLLNIKSRYFPESIVISMTVFAVLSALTDRLLHSSFLRLFEKTAICFPYKLMINCH